MTPKFTLFLAATVITISARAQNVGIGTTSPKARLHVADSAVLFTGPNLINSNTPVDPPVIEPGSRLMWYPQKAAFRAGYVDANFYWSRTNIGIYSIAAGINTTASGEASVSMGASNAASGNNATSFGFGSLAEGKVSTSMGLYTYAPGENATSTGYLTRAKGAAAFSMGFSTSADGETSTSMGYDSKAIGFASTSMGYFTTAKAYASSSMGNYTIASSANSLAIGIYNDTTAVNSLFEVGNGTTNSSRSNALTILKNGNTGIGTIAPTGPLSFKNEVGNKIVLYGNGAAVHYGIGIQGAALQLYADVPGSNILFGSGSSGSFAERMRIINTGADGLQLNGRIVLKNGTGSPNDPPGIWFYKADNSTQLGFFGTRDLQNIGFFGGPAGWGFVYDALNSRVGIGTTTPSQALQVVGNIISSGTITPSDARYKKDITNISNPLQKLMYLNGVTYHYRSDDFPAMRFSDRQQVGLIAQDVEKVFPQLVFEDDKGYKAVDYVKLIPLLIESIKTQQQEIDALKQQVKKIHRNK